MARGIYKATIEDGMVSLHHFSSIYKSLKILKELDYENSISSRPELDRIHW